VASVIGPALESAFEPVLSDIGHRRREGRIEISRSILALEVRGGHNLPLFKSLVGLWIPIREFGL
jgi:hypothetical protein